MNNNFVKKTIFLSFLITKSLSGDSLVDIEIHIPLEQMLYEEQEFHPNSIVEVPPSPLFRMKKFSERTKDNSDYGIGSTLHVGFYFDKDEIRKGKGGYQAVDYKQVLSCKEKTLFEKELKNVPSPVIPKWVVEDEMPLYKSLYKDGYAYGKMFLVYKPLNEISYYEGDDRPWINGFRDAIKEKGYSLNDFTDYAMPPISCFCDYISGHGGKVTVAEQNDNRLKIFFRLSSILESDEDRKLPEQYEMYMPRENSEQKAESQKQFSATLANAPKPPDNPYKSDKEKASVYELWYRRAYTFTVCGFGVIKFLTTDWDDESRRPILDGWTDGQRNGYEAYLQQAKAKKSGAERVMAKDN